ncbi:MAG: hypothetical protein AB1465_04400 [Patescibacteria group bacterium]
MSLTATEQDILNTIGKLKEASSTFVARQVMISPGYAEYLCRYIAKKGYLELTTKGTYRLTQSGRKLLISQGGLWDKEIIKTMAGELAKELGKTLPFVERRRGKRVTLSQAKAAPEIKIKEAFINPAEEVELESDLGKGPKEELASSKDLDQTLNKLKKLRE